MDDLLESSKADVNRCMQCNDIPLEQRENMWLVQVWMYTPENDESNWCRYSFDGYSELDGWKPCSEFLPISLFEHKDDGDVITINLPIEKYNYEQQILSTTTIKVQLKLDQLSTRYRCYSFATVLDQLIVRAE